jgi:hypothetical protein
MLPGRASSERNVNSDPLTSPPSRRIKRTGS